MKVSAADTAASSQAILLAQKDSMLVGKQFQLTFTFSQSTLKKASATTVTFNKNHSTVKTFFKIWCKVELPQKTFVDASRR